MPSDATVWIVLFVVVGIVVAIAVYRGYNIKLKHGGSEANFKKAKETDNQKSGGIDVAKNIEINGPAEVGNVGVKNVEIERGDSISVMDNAKIRGGDGKVKLGDITVEGVSTTNSKSDTG